MSAYLDTWETRFWIQRFVNLYLDEGQTRHMIEAIRLAYDIQQLPKLEMEINQ